MSDLYRFEFFVPSNNRSGSLNRVVSLDPNSPTILAEIYYPTDRAGNVWLTATVGWQVSSDTPKVLFKLWKDTSVIASGLAGGESCCERNYVFNMSHVDTIEANANNVYYLTAEVSNPTAGAVIVGPLTFTAAEITR